MHLSMGRLAAAVMSLSLLGLAPAQTAPSDAAGPETARRAYVGETGGNKSFNLKLTNLPDGTIRATWWTNVKTRSITKWVIKTSTTRRMDQFVKGYKVRSAGTRSAILRPASLVTPASGDYTFVKLYMYPKRMKKGARPFESATWWIRPTTTAVPAGTGRVLVGAFNVRTWNNESGPDVFRWSNRRANVTREILESGAGVVGIQEASGSADRGYGPLRQRDVIANDLAPAGWKIVTPIDPTRRPAIGERVDPGYYVHAGDTKPVKTVDGLQGTRILYDADDYTLLKNGYIDAGRPAGSTATVWIPWARFEQKSTGLRFKFVSVHLSHAADPQRGPYRMAALRVAETQRIVKLVDNLNTSYPGEQSIVVGDMNSTIYTFPNNGVHREFVRSGFYDAFSTNDLASADRPTTNSFVFPVKKSPQRRDYILTKGGPTGSFRYVNRVYQNKALTASDHYMQVAELPIG